MAQFFLKIAHLSFSMGPAPSLKMVFSYGLRPRLWLLGRAVREFLKQTPIVVSYVKSPKEMLAKRTVYSLKKRGDFRAFASR